MATYESIGNNKVKITFDIAAGTFNEGIVKAYNKNKTKFNIPGFRAGKVPQKMIESMYGKEVFYDDAINIILPEIYDGIITELELDVVSRPEIDVVNVDKENGVTVTAEVFIRPVVTVENYKGIACKKVETEVTDEEVENEIKKTLDKNARLITVTDRAVEDSDIVDISFEGSIDGVPFEGGQSDSHELTIGSHSFIDTFEDQIIGHNVDDSFDVMVNFPAEYGQEDLAGKPAVFKVKVNGIKHKELPEADDDFAQDVSEFETIAEYRADVRAKLQEKKTEQAKTDKENSVMEALIAANDFEVPESMIENQANSMMRDFAQRLSMQGMNIETYVKYTGMSIEDMKNRYKENAVPQVKGRLILEAIARQEDFAVSDDEITDELKKLAEMYKMEYEKFAEVVHDEERKSFVTDLKVRKAVEFVVANSVEA